MNTGADRQIRYQMFDVAKGIAIIAIVFGHVWRGLDSAGLLSDAFQFQVVDNFVYSWHLAVFAFVSGLFVKRSFETKGPREFLLPRLAEILWLYVIWSLAQGTVQLLAGGSTNSEYTVHSVLNLAVPTGQFWYFGWLFSALIFAAILRPWASIGRLLLGILLVSGYVLATSEMPLDYFGVRGNLITIFLLVAAWAGAKRVAVAAGRVGNSKAVVPIVVLALGALVFSAFLQTKYPSLAESLIGGFIWEMFTGFVGIFAVLVISVLISRTEVVEKFLCYLGKNSLGIFVAHIIFGSGVRVVLMKIGISDVYVHVLLGVVCGIALPLASMYLAKKIGFGWIFALPYGIRRTLSSNR